MGFRERIFTGFLDDGEKILDIAHRHIIILKIDSAKTAFFGIFLPGALALVFPQFLLAFAIWGGVGLFGLLYHFIDWYYDCWLLTNVGVIDIERSGLLDITSTRIEYHMMEGMSYTIKGFLPTIFNYGDIVLDKLGAKTSVLLKDATNPKKLERTIMKLQEKYIYDRSIRDHHALKDMLSDMIAYHIQNDKIKVQKRD